jgi:hypothetical protein
LTTSGESWKSPKRNGATPASHSTVAHQPSSHTRRLAKQWSDHQSKAKPYLTQRARQRVSLLQIGTGTVLAATQNRSHQSHYWATGNVSRPRPLLGNRQLFAAKAVLETTGQLSHPRHYSETVRSQRTTGCHSMPFAAQPLLGPRNLFGHYFETGNSPRPSHYLPPPDTFRTPATTGLYRNCSQPTHYWVPLNAFRSPATTRSPESFRTLLRNRKLSAAEPLLATTGHFSHPGHY